MKKVPPPIPKISTRDSHTADHVRTWIRGILAPVASSPTRRTHGGG